MILYTDHEPFVCNVLRARVADGGLLPGDVWERDVRTLTADELKPYTQVHLFAGIGASPLGLKWAGWPAGLSVVTGGFPCQSVSVSGKGLGEKDKRFLWPEMMRAIDIVRPVYVIVENSPALRARGGDRVLGDLERADYSTGAFVLGAEDLGAPHQRDRVWIVAKSRIHRSQTRQVSGREANQKRGTESARIQRPVPHAWPPRPSHVSEIPRAIDGLPGWVDKRSRNAAYDALGNAQVPQVVELIARAILQTESTPERSEA